MYYLYIFSVPCPPPIIQYLETPLWNTIPNLPQYNEATYKHPQVNQNSLQDRAGTPNLRQANSQFPINKAGTSSYSRTNPHNIRIPKPINENSHFPSITSVTFQPM